MLNFNNRPKSSLERLENVLSELTPNPETFDSIYSTEEIKSDEKLLETMKKSPMYKVGEERSDAKLLEKTFTDMVERGDWFYEDELYGDDPEYRAIVTSPSSEIDDVFNHIDVIAAIDNELTGDAPVPFAIDLTYNTDEYKMGKKFNWKHVREKKKNAPAEASEFGEAYEETDSYGRTVRKTRPLALKHRYGLKIPGFASAKYYEDKNSSWDPIIEKGRIDIMPRFVVGYSTDIADTLSAGLPSPTPENIKKYGERGYDAMKREYKTAERRAKWCTLFELSAQANDMSDMLNNLTEEETRWMQPEELAEAKRQIDALVKYFDNAVMAATEKAESDPNEKAAWNYIDRDSVFLNILNHSQRTYSLPYAGRKHEESA